MHPKPVSPLRRLRRRLGGLAVAGAVALPLLAAVPAHARYDQPMSEGYDCPPGTKVVLVGDSRLPGYPAYCAIA
jgi:hypothetical protein